jgi:hypothetical protein
MEMNETFLKRHKIISLLYLVFITFSLLNIKVSVLDSNVYTINTLQELSNIALNKVEFTNELISNNKALIDSSIKSKSYIKISKRIKISELLIRETLSQIDFKFKKNKTNLYKEFNNEFFLNDVFDKKIHNNKIINDLKELSDVISNSNYKLKSNFNTLIPIQNKVNNLRSEELEFEKYFFIDKPTFIGYLQLERIKLILINAQLQYNEAALSEIGLEPFSFSYLYDKKYLKNYFPPNSIKDSRIFLEKHSAKVTDVPLVEIKNDTILNDLYKNIASSIHTDNIMQGIQYTLFNNFKYDLSEDFKLQIIPTVKVINRNNDYFAVFNKAGEYTISFTDVRKGNVKIFTKKITVNSLPDPVVKLKGDNSNRYFVTVKNLLSAGRLDATLKINNLNYFPGRINSYNVIKIHNDKEENTVINNSELFQSATLKLISSLEKNDILIFENINISLVDGTSRITQPIVYKIIE